MSDSIIRAKSFQFAIRVVNSYKALIAEKKEFVMSKQLLRSGTAIGANIREAINAQSAGDFIHKMAISQKECDETLYWLELLHETSYINENEFKSLHNEASEILKIIRSIILTTKQNQIPKTKPTHNS